MKKILFSTLACLAFTAVSFANNGNGNDLTKTSNKKSEISNKNNEDAVKCNVTISDEYGNSVTLSCWFCDCTQLSINAELALEKKTESSKRQEYLISR